MGGKRKSSKPPPKKVAPKLAKLFTCPFCNNEKSVSAKLDYDSGMGKVTCETCNANYEARITTLSEPIDVYSDWIDACEAEKKKAAPAGEEAEDE
jgi:transcription elongation factor Elf1